MIELTQPYEVELPAGLLDGNGVSHKSVRIMPMTGAVRKTIARPDIRREAVNIANAILCSCVKSIGDINQITIPIVNSLILGDREYLLMKIRQYSSGPHVNFTLTCSSCEEPFDGTINLEEVPIVALPSDVEIVTTEGESQKRAFWVFRIQSEKYNVDATFRFPTGNDQAAVSKILKANAVAGVYQMLWRCLVSFNGTPKDLIPPTIFDDMALPIIDFIQNEFRLRQPGPDFSEPAYCPNCGAENAISFQTSDFFFDLTSMRRRQQERLI
ncbi:MAG: hypothetical protein QXT63_06330 [Thermoplasmata archaeon]